MEFATHHLAGSQLLGDLEETKQALAAARAVVEAAPDALPFADVHSRISEYEAVLQDWELYSQSPQGSFTQWCANRGRAYSWSAVIRYQK